MCRVGKLHWPADDALTPWDSALSRSAQFWSSYSGYLREIRTLKREDAQDDLSDGCH